MKVFLSSSLVYACILDVSIPEGLFHLIFTVLYLCSLSCLVSSDLIAMPCAVCLVLCLSPMKEAETGQGTSAARTHAIHANRIQAGHIEPKSATGEIVKSVPIILRVSLCLFSHAPEMGWEMLRMAPLPLWIVLSVSFRYARNCLLVCVIGTCCILVSFQALYGWRTLQNRGYRVTGSCMCICKGAVCRMA